MNRLRVLFFFGVLAIVILIARHNSKPNSRAESPTFAPPPVVVASPVATSTPAVVAPRVVNQTPAPQPNPPQSAALQKVAENAGASVILVSAFDEAGKFLRTGTGCFISEDGRFITSSSVVQGAAHAVAKTTDGKIYNVSGVLADAPALDVAVLKADLKTKAPFLLPNKSAAADNGTLIAVVASPLTRRKPTHFEGTITARRSDPTGEWLELSTPVPNENIGAPVLSEKGDFIGVVTSQRAQGAVANIARNAGTLDALVAQIDPHVTIGWQAAQNSPNNGPSPPGEGPTKLPPRFAKIPLVRADQPGNSRLIFSPKPAYPNAARRSTTPLQGNGRFRVKFAPTGEVKQVEVLESTHNPTLDGAATETLRRWKAAPGQEWSATVPISFQP